MKITNEINPQPKNLGNDVWEFDNDIHVSSDQLESYLFHEYYGNHGTPFGALYDSGGGIFCLNVDGYGDSLWEITDVSIQKIDNVWYWVIKAKPAEPPNAGQKETK